MLAAHSTVYSAEAPPGHASLKLFTINVTTQRYTGNNRSQSKVGGNWTSLASFLGTFAMSLSTTEASDIDVISQMAQIGRGE